MVIMKMSRKLKRSERAARLYRRRMFKDQNEVDFFSSEVGPLVHCNCGHDEEPFLVKKWQFGPHPNFHGVEWLMCLNCFDDAIERRADLVARGIVQSAPQPKQQETR
jgi:hypothetical protein